MPASHDHTKRRCPLCHHSLTQSEYDRVLGVQQAKERELRDARDAAAREKKLLLEKFRKQQQNIQTQQEALKRDRQALREQKSSLKAQYDAKLKSARTVAQAAERKKAEATIKRLELNLKKAQIENEHLKNATNQSEVGRAWDGEMADFLAGIFAPLGDHVEATIGSRKGDVIFHVRHNGEVVCPIIIENKTGLDVTLEFIRQASRAKRQRKARYALLVSDGRRAGFEGGVKIESDVILVRPAALVTLLHLIREAHVELARAKASAQRIDEVSSNLKAYVQGDNFRTPMDAIVKTADDLEAHLANERRQTEKWWQLRQALYGQISMDGKSIKKAVHAILEGRPIETKIVPIRRTAADSHKATRNAV